MSTPWLKLMMEEIARKRREAEDARAEAQRAGASSRRKPAADAGKR
jgi:hypothetical protein